MWGNQVLVIQFTVFDTNFLYLTAFNTFIEILKLGEKNHICGLVMITDS
jgi:hypothetical protein